MIKVGDYVYATEDCLFSSIVNWVGKVVDIDLENQRYIIEYYFNQKPIRYSLQSHCIKKYNQLHFDLLRSVRISDNDTYGAIVSYDVSYQKYIIKFLDCLTFMSEEELLKYNNVDTNTQNEEEKKTHNLPVIQDSIKKFKCRNFQEVEFQDDYILLSCSDYLIVIRIANSKRLYLTIASEDICIVFSLEKDYKNFKYKIVENKATDDNNNIKIDNIDNCTIIRVRSIDYKGQIVVDKFKIKINAETGELVEIEC